MINDRKLGYIETLCQLGHDEIHGMGNISVLAKIQGPLNINMIREASQYLYKHHPLLKASIYFSKEKDNFYFKFDNSFVSIPIEFSEITNEKEINKIYELELDRLFDTNKYLWRILLLQEQNQAEVFYIIFSMHHAIADGTSSAYLINELLNYCHSIYYKEKISVNVLPVYKSLEELVPTSPDWRKYLKGNQSAEWGSIQNISGQERKYISTLSYDKHQPIGKRQTHCLNFVLNERQMEVLKLKCNQENVTINSALGAALLKSAQKQIQEPIKLMLYTAISLRGKCIPSIPVNELGCYASVIKEQYVDIVDKNNFWDLARTYQNDLQRELVKGSEFFPKNTKLSEIRKTFNTKAISNAKEFNLNYMLTNLGRVNFACDISPFELKNIRFVGSRQGGDQVMVVAVLTVNNHMFLNFAYTCPLLSDNWANSFANNFLAVLLENIRACPKTPKCKF